MSSITKEISSGIDYLTCSLKPSPTGENLFWALAKSIKDHSVLRGCDERRWRFYGYEGFILTDGGVGHFAYGDHHTQGYLVQMSGEFSLRYWLDFVNCATNISRIDIKTDAELFVPKADMAKECYDWIAESEYGRKKFSLIQGLNTGQTLYVGSRLSEQFGRLYDKSAESGSAELGRVWRYEVEFKGGRAKAVALELSRIANESPIQEFYASIAATCYDWFDKRHVPPVWDRKGQAIKRLSIVAESEMGKVAWIRQQVSPTVKRLITRGKGLEVIDALGLREFYELTPLPGEDL